MTFDTVWNLILDRRPDLRDTEGIATIKVDDIRGILEAAYDLGVAKGTQDGFKLCREAAASTLREIEDGT